MSLCLLLREAVAFEPVGKVTTVFYDDRNHQIFSVRSGGVCGIVVKGFNEEDYATFRLESQSPITTIQISPDAKILALQPSKSEVRFYGIQEMGQMGQLDSRFFSQSSRAKTGAYILGFAWLNATEIVYFTSQGLEMFSVLLDRRLLKSLRSHVQTLSWYVFCPRSSLAVAASQTLTNWVQPFFFKNGCIYKLPKIEYDGTTLQLKERDVSILNLYDQTYIGVVVHKEDSPVELHLYAVTKEFTQVNKTKILEMPVRGQISLNVVDDLVIVHHQASLISYCFDVSLSGSFDGTATHYTPICSGQVSLESDELFEMYSPHWVIFRPDVIVDAKVGRMWKLHVAINASIAAEIQELPNLASFLLNRSEAKQVLLQVLLQTIPETRLSTLRSAFDIINEDYSHYLTRQAQPSIALSVHTFTTSSSTSSLFKLSNPEKVPSKVVLEQSDFYTHLFSPLREDVFCYDIENCEDEESLHREQSRRRKRLIGVLTEYTSSLMQFNISPEYFLDELIINLYVQGQQWYQIQQLLQYQVISDSKPMACLLLSLEKVFPASYQLAMDMLHRLTNSNEEICEILLSKGRVTSALLFAHTKGLDYVPARKFLEAALECESEQDFFNVFDFYNRKDLIRPNLKKFTELFERKWRKSANTGVQNQNSSSETNSFQ